MVTADLLMEMEMTKIVIAADADFTPKGKRTARIITTRHGGRQLRWYVGGWIFRRLDINQPNLTMTAEWLSSVTTHELIDEFNWVGSRHHY